MTQSVLASSQREGATKLPVITPEGVKLDFTLARGGDRLSAFLIDNIFMIVLMLLLWALGFDATRGTSAAGWIYAFVMLMVFLLQTFYFIWFESRGKGMTPGKKRFGIRVMERDGGTLTSHAIVVRNLVRNLEVYIPFAALLAPEALWPGAPGWIRVLSSLWLFLLAGLPMFNKRRLRIGDLVAGTVVVESPKAKLLTDLGGVTTKPDMPAQPRFRFTREQLDVYGTYELQVLEDVLRRHRDTVDWHTLKAVADRIMDKIDWYEHVRQTEMRTFLLEYYTALRAHLEQKMLFGKKKKDKFSREQ